MELQSLRRELADTILRFAWADGRTDTAIDGVILHRRSDPLARHFCFYEPVLALIAQGSKTLTLADQTYVYDEANYLISTFDLPVTSQLTRASAARPYLSFNLRIDPGMVGEMVAEMPPEPRQPPSALMVGPVSAPLVENVLRLIRLLETPADIPVLAPLYQKEIYYRLLTGPLGGRLRAMALPGGRGPALARVLRWLRMHFDEPMQVEHLAREAGLSISALHHQFKAVTGISPLRFQKQLRLQEARRRMLAGQTATAAARAVGYDSASQFSRDYSRVFGNAPGKDVAQLRPAREDAA